MTCEHNHQRVILHPCGDAVFASRRRGRTSPGVIIPGRAARALLALWPWWLEARKGWGAALRNSWGFPAGLAGQAAFWLSDGTRIRTGIWTPDSWDGRDLQGGERLVSASPFDQLWWTGDPAIPDGLHIGVQRKLSDDCVVNAYRHTLEVHTQQGSVHFEPAEDAVISRALNHLRG